MSWTNTGDDGPTGRAAKLQIKHAPGEIVEFIPWGRKGKLDAQITASQWAAMKQGIWPSALLQIPGRSAEERQQILDEFNERYAGAHATGRAVGTSENVTVRSVFVIGPDKAVKLTLTYPASTGRNFDEVLRVIDSLQLTANHQVATPANWKDGDDCIIIPAVPDADVPGKFPKGHRTIKPYLRYTPQPNK